MGKPWTVEEIQMLLEVTYLPVLLEELAGGTPVKADALRRGEEHLPWRTHHTLKDRCYRISEVLNDEGYPWVAGWKPPALVGQAPNSPGVTAMIRKAVLPLMSRQFGRPGTV